MKKLTKREKFEMLKAIPAVQENGMLIEFINHELELLTKKNATDKKPTAAQIVNESIKDAIVARMEEGKGYTITDMIKTFPECADQSNQRINALVRQMVPERIDRVVIKRRAYFCLPGTVLEEEKGE